MGWLGRIDYKIPTNKILFWQGDDVSFLTRPSLGAWTAEEGEFRLRAQAVTQAVVDGTLNIRVSEAYPLAEARQAHRDLQERRTTGSLVLRVTD